MPCWYYFSRPTNMAFHNFTTYINPPANIRALLGLGLQFIPTPFQTTPWTRMQHTTFQRLQRDIRLKCHFAGEASQDDKAFNKKMYIPSEWTPDPKLFPQEVRERLKVFDQRLYQIFPTKRGSKNLLPHQRRTLQTMQKQKKILIVQCDKKLGPAAIETEEYIKMGLRDHLSDINTYKRIATDQLPAEEKKIKLKLQAWLKQYSKHLNRAEKRFIKVKMEDPATTCHSALYLTLKAHKKGTLKSRPVCSTSGTILEALGLWVDKYFQPIARDMPSYFKNSEALVQELQAMTLPPGTKLFTADAVSMYTNIPTNKALRVIGQYLFQREGRLRLPREAFMEALTIIMKNNIVEFGDTYWLQKSGTAMGTPPAPPYATVYYGIKEIEFLKKKPPNLL